MTGFLEHIAGYMLEKHGSHLNNIAVVFPNRRAGLWFRHDLSAIAEGPVWSPAVFTIESLIEHLTGKSKTDSVLLVMELYRIWKEILPEGRSETLDRFYRWGEMLTGDFDDMDKYLVQADALFRNLKSLKDVELDYLTEEQKVLIRQFWDHFPEGEGSRESRAFASLWQHLGEIYHLFRTRLQEKDMAYEGMLYREVSEMAENNRIPLDQWEFIYFIGFHALTPAEEKLFVAAKRMKRAAFFWDYDVAYLNHPGTNVASGKDAGYFIRKVLKEFPPPEEAEIYNNLLDQQKQVSVYAMPSRTSQAAVGKNLLEKWYKEPAFRAERTALVLADELLLLPVVHAVPEKIAEMNITMGYPVRHTPLYGLFSLMMELHIHALRNGKKIRFHTGRIIDIIRHPLINMVLPPGWKKWGEKISKGNMLWIGNSELPESGPLLPLFAGDHEAPEVASTIIDILYEIIIPSESDVQPEINDGGMNTEAYYQLTLLVNRLNEAVSDYHTIWDVSPAESGVEDPFVLYLRLLSQMAAAIKIPFYGEPLAGLQVMGLLETRLLDFDRVILFSVNEKTLPKGISSVNSFIPYNLRKGFGMPTFDHHDAVYNYYFLRLIQRAKEVALVYHTEVDNGQTGEMSRFIPQLDYLLGLDMDRSSFTFSPDFGTASRIVVNKDEHIRRRLEALCESGLSPSALNTYLECSLRFYFRYVAGIREPDEMNIDVDQALMGTLFHKTMEMVYRPFLNREVSGENLQAILTDPSGILSLVQTSFLEILPGTKPDEKGMEGGLPGILKYAVQKFVRQTLSNDLQHTPFRIAGLEKKVERRATLEMLSESRSVVLAGKVDRIDIRDEMLYLIDYKTGNIRNSFSGIDSLFDTNEEKRNSAAFQILLYAWIMSRPQDKPIVPQLYFLRNMFNDDPDTDVVNGKEPLRDISSVIHDFDLSLHKLLLEILDPQVTFEQTRIVDRCRYCPYASICRDRV